MHAALLLLCSVAVAFSKSYAGLCYHSTFTLQKHHSRVQEVHPKTFAACPLQLAVAHSRERLACLGALVGRPVALGGQAGASCPRSGAR